jgi:hypothetical protein
MTAPAPWATVPTRRTALLVVHNTTTLNRMVDVVGVLAADRRVQCLVTSDLTDPFADGLAADVDRLGMPSIPWEQAAGMTSDLVVSASHHGRIDELAGPLVLLAHGAGFGKFAPDQGNGRRSVFGLAPEWVLQDGRPRAAALALPHRDQVDRIAADAPAALPAATVVGDPCYDRLLASRDRRPAYRAALGAGEADDVVLVTSTWGADSLLATRPGLVDDLVGALPHARIVLVAHPNVWAWHGPFQLRSWFADAVDAGLTIVPPLAGWQAALVASDVVIGDHGSVTVYGAALGRPTVLAAFPDADVVPGSAADRLGAVSPRLRPEGGVAAQVAAAVTGMSPALHDDVAGLVTSVPGQSTERLAALFSALLGLDPPLRGQPAQPYPVVVDGSGTRT